MELFEEAKLLLRGIHQAYARLFDPANKDAELILKDLIKFCRVNESTFNPDPRIHAMLEGRREVFLRIQKYTKLTPDELWELTRKDK